MISLYFSNGVSEQRYGDDWSGEIPVIEPCDVGIYYNVRVGGNFSVYSLVDKSKSLFVALQVSTSAIIVSNEGSATSPVEVLEHAVKAYDGKCLEKFLDHYRLIRRWGRASVMSGIGTAYVSAAPSMLEAVLHAIEHSHKFKKYSSVTFGEIPSSYDLVHISQADIDRRIGVSIEVFNSRGESEFVNMPPSGQLMMASTQFGFDESIFEDVVVKLRMVDIYQSLMRDCEILKYPGAEVVLMPSRARVQVSFYPPKLNGAPEYSKIAGRTSELTADVRITLPAKKLRKRKRADFIVRQIGVNSEYTHLYENVPIMSDGIFDRVTLNVPRFEGTQIVVEVGRFPEYIITAQQIDRARFASWQCVGNEQNHLSVIKRIGRSYIFKYNSELSNFYYFIRFCIAITALSLLLFIK